jgi:TOMM system kinase/cyclase fusion protein
MPRDPLIETQTLLQDRYLLQEVLSTGGFGVVYKAEQLATGQTVAIKCIRHAGPTPADDARRIARFQREVSLCAQLHHPNIVRIIDSGWFKASMYAVFQYVPGKNLADLLADEGPLAPLEAGYLMSQVLDALICAHDAGIVHRDLKPANIMVVPTGARRNAMVLDFGIGGALRDVAGHDAQSLSHTFERVGTPAYASPEQIRGRVLTARADLYSWGLVFLECLTGRRAIEGATIAEIMHRQLDAAPVPIPPMLAGHPLEELLRVCTAKDEAQRRFSARELLARLDVRGLAVLARSMATARPAGGPNTLVTHETGPRVEITPAEADEGRRHAPDRHERRQLTLVSCAISVTPGGATPLDIDTHEARLAEAVALCRTLARFLGGYLMPSAEHRVLLCFGYPTATGEDARQAVHAALAIAAALASHGAQQEAEHGMRSQVQIGVHTGLVLVRHDANDAHPGAPATFSGSAVRLAAQLDDHAPVNGVIISRPTCSLVRAHFAVSAGTPVLVPGRAEPVEIFRIEPTLTGEALLALDASGHTPFVGRESEMELLREHWRAASRGHGQSVLVTGDPGMGKSRLLREFLRELGREPGRESRREPRREPGREPGVEPLRLHGRCMPEHRHSALRPVIELMERHLGLRADAPEPAYGERWRRLEELCDTYRMDQATAMPLLAALLGVPLGDGHAPLELAPQRQRELTLHMLLSLFSDMATQRPTVLAIEDVHWADASTLELLGALSADVDALPMLVVLTARPEEGLLTARTRLKLDRLDSASAGQLIQRCAGDRALPGAIASEVLRRSEGVPLFIEEMVSTLLGSGALAAREAPGDLPGMLPPLEIPASLRELVLNRLDRLSRDARTALQLGAVLGREFRFEKLEAAGGYDAEALRPLTDALVETGLLLCRRRLSGETFVFKHALIHDAVYESIPRRVRIDFHRRIARVLEERFPEVVEKRPERLARHYAGAGQIVEALGQARRAALGALASSAYEEAIGHARQAIAWLVEVQDEKQRAELELGMHAIIIPAMFATRGHGTPEFGALMQRSLALIAVAGDSPHALPALWGLWTHAVWRLELTRALPLAQRYVERAERLGDEDARFMGVGMATVTLLHLGRARAAYEVSSAAFAGGGTRPHERFIITAGVDAEVAMLATRARCAWFLGRTAGCRADTEAALALARSLGHPATLCLALVLVVMARLWNGEHASTESDARELRAVADRHGLVLWGWYGALLLDRVQGNAAPMRATLDMLMQGGLLLDVAVYRVFLAEVEAASGRHEQAMAAITAAMEIAEYKDERYFLPEIHRRRGELLAAQADPASRADAASSFRRAIEIAEQQGAPMPAFLATASLCRTQHALDGRVDPSLLASLRALSQEIDDDAGSPVIAAARAALAMLDG